MNACCEPGCERETPSGRWCDRHRVVPNQPAVKRVSACLHAGRHREAHGWVCGWCGDDTDAPEAACDHKGVGKPGCSVCDPGALDATAPDPVHPPHYTGLSPQPIEVIEAWGLGFNLGTVVKYIGRAGRKGPALEDLRKGRFYLEREISRLEKWAGR